MTRHRLDQELVRRQLMSSRSGARLAILEGRVSVAGSTVVRPAQRVEQSDDIAVDPAARRYVGRGAHKLAAALDHFEIDVRGMRAIDIGASTGGFTDLLLQRGAAQVVALDVGHDQLHPRLRADSRVVVHEGINIRHAVPSTLGAPFGLVAVDLSFISLRLVADVVAGLGSDDAHWIVLVKPQFEVGPEALGKGGVVRSAQARAKALADVAGGFVAAGLTVAGAIASPIVGGSGNREALLWMRRAGSALQASDLYKVLQDE